MQVGAGGANEFLADGDWHTPVEAWGMCHVTATTRDGGTGCLDAPGFGSGLTWNVCDHTVTLLLHLICRAVCSISAFDG